MDINNIFRRRTFSLTLIAAALLSSVSSVNAAPINDNLNNRFSQLVTFGDSMSDGGFREIASRYIYDGQLYNEVLAPYYTGSEHVTYTKGGTNYAESGARTHNAQLMARRLNVTDRVDDYLALHKGQIDPNGLYILWAGANDISDVVEKDLMSALISAVNGEETEIKKTEDYNNAIKHTGRMAQKLVDAGAKYIIIPNLPRAGMAPFTASILPSLVDQVVEQFVNLATGNPLPILSGIGSTVTFNALLSSVDTALRATNGTFSSIEEQNRVIAEAINTGMFGIFGAEFMKQTQPMVENIFNSLYALENETTFDFNRNVEKELAAIDGNIISLDVDKLFSEIIATPGEFGFGNVLVGPCVLGLPSWECFENGKGYIGVEDTLFSDWFHPSSAGHAMMADYMISVIDAPLYVSVLSSSVERLARSKNSLLDDHLQLKKYQGEVGEFAIFGGYTGGYGKISRSSDDNKKGNEKTHDLSIGFSTKLNEELTVGAMLTGNAGNYKNSDRIKYDLFGAFGTVFAQYSLVSGLWGNADVYYGYVKMNDIERTMRLGTGIRTESGDTSGSSFGTRLNLGFSFPIADTVLLGPVVGYEWNKSKVKEYEESGNNSTSMRFQEQERSNSIGKIGLLLDAYSTIINPYMLLTYNHNFGYEAERALRASIKTTDTSFERFSATDVESWFEAKFGFNMELTDKAQLYASLTYVREDTKTNIGNASVGLSYTF